MQELLNPSLDCCYIGLLSLNVLTSPIKLTGHYNITQNQM